jgi:hypothetical protein
MDTASSIAFKAIVATSLKLRKEEELKEEEEKAKIVTQNDSSEQQPLLVFTDRQGLSYTNSKPSSFSHNQSHSYCCIIL